MAITRQTEVPAIASRGRGRGKPAASRQAKNKQTLPDTPMIDEHGKVIGDARGLIESARKAREELDHPSVTRNTEGEGESLGPGNQQGSLFPDDRHQQDLYRRPDAREIMEKLFPQPPPVGGIPFHEVQALVQQVLDLVPQGSEGQLGGPSRARPSSPRRRENNEAPRDRQLIIRANLPPPPSHASPAPSRVSRNQGGPKRERGWRRSDLQYPRGRPR